MSTWVNGFLFMRDTHVVNHWYKTRGNSDSSNYLWLFFFLTKMQLLFLHNLQHTNDNWSFYNNISPWISCQMLPSSSYVRHYSNLIHLCLVHEKKRKTGRISSMLFLILTISTPDQHIFTKWFHAQKYVLRMSVSYYHTKLNTLYLNIYTFKVKAL